MSVLSEWDIVWQLGRQIFIYPFKDLNSSLSGGSLRLTASEYAYEIETIKCKKENCSDDNVAEDNSSETIIQKKAKRLKLHEDNNNNYFLIPPRKTALVWTNESVVLNGWFCGSIHSKVRIAASSIGHIGTRVSPYWKGILSIAIHNLSDEDIKINIDDIIGYLRFHKLNSESSIDYADSLKSAYAKLQDAFPKDCSPPDELEKWILSERWRDGDTESIFAKLEKDKKESNEGLNAYERAKRAWWRRYFGFLSRYEKIPFDSVLLNLFISTIKVLNSLAILAKLIAAKALLPTGLTLAIGWLLNQIFNFVKPLINFFYQ
ncbi:hypothetical protein PCC8801_1244 [Rippkaea orientalis PCC 8801]|uniref:Uncharacterized protein n=1 Tax=Rippkaea orientalis (strain PCC 8801 / RF-1) TaxID=41431 RepID=B7K3G8_RIPO1|nr:hypothetical protein [Rippkaea orientalis]ACK65310.1 hypothetical protein PCC8801_1244 [Rippkaea orientalis PCC 8801]